MCALRHQIILPAPTILWINIRCEKTCKPDVVGEMCICRSNFYTILIFCVRKPCQCMHSRLDCVKQFRDMCQSHLLHKKKLTRYLFKRDLIWSIDLLKPNIMGLAVFKAIIPHFFRQYFRKIMIPCLSSDAYAAEPTMYTRVLHRWFLSFPSAVVLEQGEC